MHIIGLHHKYSANKNNTLPHIYSLSSYNTKPADPCGSLFSFVIYLFTFRPDGCWGVASMVVLCLLHPHLHMSRHIHVGTHKHSHRTGQFTPDLYAGKTRRYELEEKECKVCNYNEIDLLS